MLVTVRQAVDIEKTEKIQMSDGQPGLVSLNKQRGDNFTSSFFLLPFAEFHFRLLRIVYITLALL